MEFFGLAEHLHLSQRLFERTAYCNLLQTCSFQIYLKQDFTNSRTRDYMEKNLTLIDFDRIRQINNDDVELYLYAKNLFFKRTCQILGIACQ